MLLTKFIMFGSYLKSAYRGLVRDKFYASMNVLGFVLGLAATSLIGLYVQDELSYDRHQPNHERTYRVSSGYTIANQSDTVATSGLPLGPLLAREDPQVEAFLRVIDAGEQGFRYGQKQFMHDDVFYADSSFFDFFGFEFAEGTAEKALTEPNTVVLSRQVAERYFGQEPAVGKVLVREGDQPFVVVGVLADPLGNSHLRFGMLLSLGTVADWAEQASIWSFNAFTYLRVREGFDPEAFGARFSGFYDRHMAELGQSLGATYQPVLEPLASIYLDSQAEWDLPSGERRYVQIFIAIAAIILTIAVVNYTNIATARASDRAKEVGIHKVAGASLGQIRLRFLSESLLLALAGWVLAVALVEWLLPSFNTLSGKDLRFVWNENLPMLAISFGLSLLVGLASGLYPAFYLSSFKAVEVLKGKARVGKRHGGRLRKVLVGLQLGISVAMLAGTLVVQKQFDFFQNKDLGFEKGNIMVAALRDSLLWARADEFQARLGELPQVLESSFCSSALPAERTSRMPFVVELADSTAILALNFISTDAHYLATLGLRLVAGADFDSLRQGEQFILNEAAVRALGLTPEAALGTPMSSSDDAAAVGRILGRVVGVVADFNYVSLHQPIDPLVLLFDSLPLPVLNLRLGPDTEQALAEVERVAGELSGDGTFRYHLLDQTLSRFYRVESKLSQTFGYLALLAILITCLGLVGLSSFVTSQRIKEIGIRKVLGASAFEVVGLLWRELLWPFVGANLLGWLAAWWSLRQWLENFAYRVEVGWAELLWASLISLAATVLTTAYQSVKASLTDPARSLRYE